RRLASANMPNFPATSWPAIQDENQRSRERERARRLPSPSMTRGSARPPSTSRKSSGGESIKPRRKRRPGSVASARLQRHGLRSTKRSRTIKQKSTTLSARDLLERKFEAERARWKKQRERLEEALRKARSPVPLRVVK